MPLRSGYRGPFALRPLRTIPAAALALGSMGSPAWAQHAHAPGTPVALRYSAQPACPDENAFRARVGERAPVAFAAGAERSLIVEAFVAEQSYGRLVLEDRGTAVTREVTGATCDEVVSALALIAAVLLQGGPGDSGPTANTVPPPPSP